MFSPVMFNKKLWNKNSSKTLQGYLKMFTILQVPCEDSNYTMKPLNGPSIILFIRGGGHIENNDYNTRINFSAGVSLFCPAQHSLTINCNGSGLLIFQAYCVLSQNKVYYLKIIRLSSSEWIFLMRDSASPLAQPAHRHQFTEGSDN